MKIMKSGESVVIDLKDGKALLERVEALEKAIEKLLGGKGVPVTVTNKKDAKK